MLHIPVPTVVILNQFIAQENYKSATINYSSISAKSDREASVATLPLYFTVSNCRTVFFLAITMETIQAQCVLSLARDQGMEDWEMTVTFA